MASTEPHVEPDDNISDTSSVADSGLGSDAASSTASLTSSVINYQYENGRRYHAFREGAYILPNDEIEQDRLDLTHHILALLLGGHLYKAPLSEPHRILDIGTGTGQVIPQAELLYLTIHTASGPLTLQIHSPAPRSLPRTSVQSNPNGLLQTLNSKSTTARVNGPTPNLSTTSISATWAAVSPTGPS